MNERVARGTGAENTLYDKRRHEMMKLRPIGRFYGNIIVGLKSNEPNPVCVTCEREIITPHLVIFGQHVHSECYNKR